MGEEGPGRLRAQLHGHQRAGQRGQHDRGAQPELIRLENCVGRLFVVGLRKVLVVG